MPSEPPRQPPGAGRGPAPKGVIPPIATPATKKRILVCDDVAQIRKILSFNLRQANYDTIEAEDGAEAIRITETQPIDLILLDVMTPNIDGFTACGRIKANPKTKDVPIIMLTACSQKTDVIRALSSGAADYILKPFKRDTVLEKIARVLYGEAGAPPAQAPAPPGGAGRPPSAGPGHS